MITLKEAIKLTRDTAEMYFLKDKDAVYGEVEVMEEKEIISKYDVSSTKVLSIRPRFHGYEYVGIELEIEKESIEEKIYTHDKAADVIGIFEDVLDEYNIKVPSPEDDEREADNDAAIYGSVYSDLIDNVEELLIKMLEAARVNYISYEFSQNY